MMERLLARGQALAQSRTARAIDRIADALDLPRDVRIERAEARISILGRRLKYRVLTDPRLRGLIAVAAKVLP